MPAFAQMDLSMLTDAALALAVSIHFLAWHRNKIKKIFVTELNSVAYVIEKD